MPSVQKWKGALWLRTFLDQLVCFHLSEVIEKLTTPMHQLPVSCSNSLSSYMCLSGVRESYMYSCQDLLTLVNMHNSNVCGNVLTDLSKSFECLPYRL